MEMRTTRGSRSTRVSMLLAVAMVAVLSLGALAGCGGNGSGGAAASGASSADATTKTLVKTATNEMTLVDWDVSEADSPITVTSDDAKFADYVDDLREITGYDIESLTMQVKVTEFAGAEIAATHENVKDNTYAIESLEGGRRQDDHLHRRRLQEAVRRQTLRTSALANDLDGSARRSRRIRNPTFSFIDTKASYSHDETEQKEFPAGRRRGRHGNGDERGGRRVCSR